MAEDQTAGVDTRRFVTAAINLLHAAFIGTSRAQAKRRFARIHGGALLDLARLRLDERTELHFRVALDWSEFRGRIGFTPFRKALAQLLARLAERVRLRGDIAVYSEEASGAMLFYVPAVTEDEGRTNVLMLGLDTPEPGSVTLRLQFLDPQQFQRSAQ